MTNHAGRQGKVDELRAAAAVARHVELEDIQLLDLQAKRLASVEDILRTPSHIEVEREHQFDFDERGARLTVELTATVQVVADGEDAQPLVLIAARLQLGYRLLVDPPPLEVREEFFRSFALVNGPYNGWPYLRELVQTTSTRMGIPPVVLPVFRIERPRGEETGREAPQPGARPVARRKVKKVAARRK